MPSDYLLNRLAGGVGIRQGCAATVQMQKRDYARLYQLPFHPIRMGVDAEVRVPHWKV